MARYGPPPIREYDLLILGLTGSGKSHFVANLINYRSCAMEIKDAFRIEADIHRTHLILDDNEVVPIDIFDSSESFEISTFFSSVPDEEEIVTCISPTIATYILERTDGIIFLYSITSRESFQEVSRYYRLVKDLKNGDLEGIKIVLVGSKCDLEGERVVSGKEGRALAESLGCQFFEVSTVTGVNIKESVVQLVREIRSSEASSSNETGADSKKGGVLAVTRRAMREWIGKGFSCLT
ncbi:Ras GTPase [Arthrobotrys conoides]|uniref:small monomeric GTPase n=1 Tax=Arthrobotrys conoides TaxID=74498 RepID=A0AAN8NB35_9PEZI